MIITHETTIEEYEAWLATNPSMSAFKVAARSTFKTIYRTLDNIVRIVRAVRGKAQHRACTAGRLVKRTVYPLTYNKNAAASLVGFDKWLRSVKYELSITTTYLQILEDIDCLDDEKAMEALRDEALEILKSN